MLPLKSVQILLWPGGSVGWSVIPCSKNVVGSIPGQSTQVAFGFNPPLGHIWASLSPAPPLLLALKAIKTCPQVRGKNDTLILHEMTPDFIFLIIIPAL